MPRLEETPYNQRKTKQAMEQTVKQQRSKTNIRNNQIATYNIVSSKKNRIELSGDARAKRDEPTHETTK